MRWRCWGEVGAPKWSPGVALVGAQRSRGSRRSFIERRIGRGGGGGTLPRCVMGAMGGGRARENGIARFGGFFGGGWFNILEEYSNSGAAPFHLIPNQTCIK
jgi:hypothetical protein